MGIWYNGISKDKRPEGGGRMDYIMRREEILRILGESDDCISAAQLAERFGVTRQIIVSDVALLRDNGHRIAATRRGYRLEKLPGQGQMESILCRHSSDQVLDEFYAVVDNGGSVVNVMVEHPVYGAISAELNISSRYDAQEFVKRMQSANAPQLSDLAGGVHIHMLCVPDRETYQRIAAELEQKGILVDPEK